ncbi:recombinase RecT [Candidatus Saccharibacteria bacterium]|nr:recombinase RecT [Candidatus Saccharibacteria bacterium]
MTRESVARAVDTAAPVAAPTSAAPGRYVSIFENPARFSEMMNAAGALAKTQFVPKAFQGKPEDCLVALDMAARMDLNPLAVFPDIYIIDGRASFSSKFLIALVNKSGRFSRIQFETGIDGEAEVTFGAWGENKGQRKRWKEKIINHYAVASFTELASGARYESPRVDCVFADRNGWFEKDGSKWRTMPEIMTRYRAASILIKSVCPEIIMGLEFADDLQDARDDTPPRSVVVERRGAPSPAPVMIAPSRVDCVTPSTVASRPVVVEINKGTIGANVIDAEALPGDMEIDEMRARLESAQTVDDLKAAAQVIAEYELDPSDAENLRQIFKRRRAELAAQTQAGAQVIPPRAGLPGETVFNTAAVIDAIEKAGNVDALTALSNEVYAAQEDGRLSKDDAADLLARIARRRETLQPGDAPATSEQPTNEQLTFETNLRGALVESAKAGDLERLDKNAALITDWAEQGYITQAQASALFAHYEELKGGLTK